MNYAEKPKGLTDEESKVWDRSIDDRESRLIVGSEVRSLLKTIATQRMAIRTYGESILGGYSDHNEGKVMKQLADAVKVPVMSRAALIEELLGFMHRHSNSALATNDKEKIREIDIGVEALRQAIKEIEAGGR